MLTGLFTSFPERPLLTLGINDSKAGFCVEGPQAGRHKAFYVLPTRLDAPLISQRERRTGNG